MEKGSPHTLHLDEDVLEQYALGKLTDDAQLEAAEEHLLVCVRCQSKLEQIDKFVTAFRDAGEAIQAQNEGPEQSEKTKPTSWSRPFLPVAVAAAAAIVFFGPSLLQQDGQPVSVALVAMRNEANPSAPSGKPLILTLDLAGTESAAASALRYEVAAANGAPVASGEFSRNEPNLRIAALSAGQYWVRVYKTGETNPIREFSLPVK
jgi:hypothetical protein